MKLTTYNVFKDRVRELPEVIACGATPEIYRYHEEAWFNESNQVITEKSLVIFLNETKTKKIKSFRPARQKTCFFWIESIKSVVAINFTTFLKTDKLSAFASLIATCHTNSKNEFDATHDALTLLPNRKHFEEKLNECISKMLSIETFKSASAPGSNSEGLTLLAFDLDHFKQINDTFGHPYGDIVLAAFAWRLEEFAREIESSRPIRAYPARLGGEEFQLLLSGMGNDIDGLVLANEFRQRVNKSSLPSEIEWAKLALRRGVSNERLPTEAERTVSVSIGHALLTATEAKALSNSLGSTVQIASTLIDQADAALYRAKTDGRDCARSFREIKDRLGRVLEHHNETGIVTIDIGTEVGVKSGMEFLVFHPHFYGNYPFYQKDTRTKKILGTYPKYPSGRLTVFSCTKEISFAHVVENKQHSLFHEGSRLEYVPLGSFTHLVTSSLELTQPNIASYDQLVAKTKLLAKERKRILAVNFEVQDMESLVISKGTAYGNDILAAVYRLIQSSFEKSAVIATTSPTDFLLLVDYDKKSTEKTIREKINLLLKNIGAHAKCIAGIYDSSSTEINLEKPEMAIECARMAIEREGTSNVFAIESAHNVIQKWRSNREWAEGIADYIRLKSFGISTSSIENIAGLCYLEQNNSEYSNAIQCFMAAIDLVKKDKSNNLIDLYERNLAYAYSGNGNHLAAINIFRKHLLNLPEDSVTQPVYIASYARSIYFETTSNPNTIPESEIKYVIEKALNEAKGYLTQEWVKALSSLKKVSIEQ